jgi:hypothetical protein
VRNWWEIHGIIGRLGVRFTAQRVGEEADNVAKIVDAMDLIRVNAASSRALISS